MHRLLGSVLTWAAIGLVGCSGTMVAGPDGAVQGDGSSAPELSATTDTGTGPFTCQSTVQCPIGKLCDPKTSLCVDQLACAQHSDCGKAAYCETSKLCARSKTGSPCAGTDNCMPAETCVGGFCGCKGQHYQAQSVPPNVLIVLDRSTSMKDTVPGGTKASVARQAIANLLSSYGSQIRFGLAAYPGSTAPCDKDENCQAGGVFVDVADHTSSQILSFLGVSGAICQVENGTPTAEMLSSLLSYPGLKDTTRPNYILLLTDGQSGCGDPVPVVTALRNQTPSVKTFVIGFGETVDPNELNGMAQEGGTAITGGSKSYYVASDSTSLSTAFSTIAGKVLSCTYTLSEVPKDLTQLYVYQGKQQILRDTTHAGGWDYDSATNRITFYGAACEALKSGQVASLVIVYGCPLQID